MSTVERGPYVFSAFICRSLTLHQSSMLLTLLKPIVHRGLEYGLKVPGPYRSVGWLQRVTWKKKIKSSTKKYHTPSKLQNEIKKNYCCLNVYKNASF